MRDSSGQDYADQRYFGVGTGRFWSADPAGLATAHLGKPGSWNRYAYVLGDPINFRDRKGLDACDPDDDDSRAAVADDDTCVEDPDVDGDGGGPGSGTYTALSAYTDPNNGELTISDPSVTPSTTVTVTATADPVSTVQVTTYVTLTTSQQTSIFGPYLSPGPLWPVTTGLTVIAGPVIAGPAPPPQPPVPLNPILCLGAPSALNFLKGYYSTNNPVGPGKGLIPPNPLQTNYGNGTKQSGYGNGGFDTRYGGIAEGIDYGANLFQCVAGSQSGQ